MSYTVDVQAALAERWDAVIDVRSPSEYAEDHWPGAVNWPVLSDDERRQVGTLYKDSPFEARKLGAAMVARNIARHLDERATALDKGWRPLVYCWRGGQRSGAMNWFLSQVGFRSRQLVGGYKAFRARVREDLAVLSPGLHYRVLCGLTGSGKTRLLHALAAQGGQVLDLEGLAQHRGSVLGALPDAPQPSQKAFDSRLWQRLRELDPTRPVFVESESRKIGRISLPAALMDALHRTPDVLWVDMPETSRIELLLQDYAHFSTDPDAFCLSLEGLVELRGRRRVQHWQDLARSGQWAEVFTALIREHYDPGYAQSLRRHFTAAGPPQSVSLAGLEGIADAARQLLAP